MIGKKRSTKGNEKNASQGGGRGGGKQAAMPTASKK